MPEMPNVVGLGLLLATSSQVPPEAVFWGVA